MNTLITSFVKGLVSASKVVATMPAELHNVYRTQGTLVAADKNEHLVVRAAGSVLATASKDSIIFIPSMVITGYGFILAKRKNKAILKRMGLGIVSGVYLYKARPTVVKDLVTDAIDNHQA